MTIFSYFRLFHAVLHAVLLQGVVKAADPLISCNQSDSAEVAAYTFWPFRVDCNHLEAIWKTSANHTSGDVFQCNVTHNGIDHPAGIFELSSSADGLIFETKLIVNDSFCLSSSVEIILQDFPEGTCQELVEEAGLRGEIISRQATTGGYVELRCIPPAGTPTLIPEGVDRDLFTTSWHTKCEKKDYRDNNLWRNVEDPDGYPDKLTMPRVDFYDATNFTCNVTYKRRSLYPITYAQCIKQSVTMKDPTVACTKSENEPKGALAQLDCAAQIVNGLTSSDDFRVEWMQGDKTICRNTFFNKISKGLVNSRTSCIVEGRNESLPCIEDGENTSDDDIPRGRKKLELKLNISHLEENDFGDYSVVVSFRDNGDWSRDTWDPINLTEDRTPFYEKLVVGLSTAFGVLVFLVLVYILLWRFWIYILVAYKRSRLRKYDKDDSKRWVAYLSYYFDGSPDSESAKKSSEATKKIVGGIHKVMENLEYPYYDEQKQGDFSVAVEKITNLVEDCHRMIFVLTPEYLEDKWRRFHAELGWHALLESRIGLVFILTPGVQKVLKKSAENDPVWRNLLVAFKTYRVIKWKESMSEDELMRHIEYSMPKLRKSQRHHLSYGNDSTNMAVNPLQIPEYERSMSQTTACTILTPDTPPPDVNNFV